MPRTGLEGDTGWLLGGGRDWGAQDSGSGLRRPSPARLRRLLAPPPAPSRKVPKRSPNVRKRNFLFPTLERAALRWLRGDLGTLLPRRRGPGVEEGGEGGVGDAEAPPSPPPIQRFSFNRPSFPSAPLFPANLLLLKGAKVPLPPSVGGRGAAGLTPLPLGLSPLPSPAAPGLARAGLCARARWGEGSQPPPARLPRRNPARGGDGGGGRGPGAAVQTCFLPPAAAAARAPVCGCVPRPAHPPRPPLARRVGAALKGLRAVLRRLGIGAEEGGRGVGQGCGVL